MNKRKEVVLEGEKPRSERPYWSFLYVSGPVRTLEVPVQARSQLTPATPNMDTDLSKMKHSLIFVIFCRRIKICCNSVFKALYYETDVDATWFTEDVYILNGHLNWSMGYNWVSQRLPCFLVLPGALDPN